MLITESQLRRIVREELIKSSFLYEENHNINESFSNLKFKVLPYLMSLVSLAPSISHGKYTDSISNKTKISQSTQSGEESGEEYLKRMEIETAKAEKLVSSLKSAISGIDTEIKAQKKPNDETKETLNDAQNSANDALKKLQSSSFSSLRGLNLKSIKDIEGKKLSGQKVIDLYNLHSIILALTMKTISKATKNGKLGNDFDEKIKAVEKYIVQQVTSGNEGNADNTNIYSIGNQRHAQFTTTNSIVNYYNKIF